MKDRKRIKIILGSIIFVVFLLYPAIEVNDEIGPRLLTNQSKSEVDKDAEVKEEVEEEIEVVVEPKPIKPIEGIKLGNLDVKHVIISPHQDSVTEVGLNFHTDIDVDIDTAYNVILMDQEESLIAKYSVDSSKLLSEMANAYEIDMVDLEAGQKYTYVLTDGQSYSQRYEFTTMDNQAFDMIFFGDIQGYKLSHYEAFRETYDMAVNEVGMSDIAYIAGDIVDKGDSIDQWSYFYHAMEIALTKQLILTSIGNHDVKGSSDYYLGSFNYAKNGIENLMERTYYIDVAGGRIVAFDTESYSRYEDQEAWLDEVFFGADEGFKIVVMHRSVFPMSYDEGHVRNLAQSFESAGVDLVLSGHDHIYSRTTINSKEKVELGSGVTYIVGGSGSGSKYYEAGAEAHRYWKHIVYDDDNPVFTHIKIEDNTLRVVAFARTETGPVEIDHFELTN